MERVEPEPRGDRRAGGEREHDAGQHQAPMAASVSRSTVHHHSPKGVRCARETMSPSPSGSQADAGRFTKRLLHSGALAADRYRGIAAPDRGTPCRAPRNSGTGRRRRRPATAAPPAPCSARRRGIARGGVDRGRQRAGDLVRHLAVERRGEIVGRLADQIGLADARKKFGEAVDAAGLRPAAGDPENSGKARQRLGGGVGVGGL